MHEPWLSQDGKEIDEKHLLKLYTVHSEEQISHLDSHYKYRNYYTTILSALLAIFVGGMLQFHDTPFAPALIFLLVCIVVLSEFGKKTTDRYYRRFLESVTILAKLDNALGFDKPINVKREVKNVLWSNDKQLLPERWVSDCQKHNSSKDFISERMKMGDNRYANWTFTFFEIMSLVYGVIAIHVYLVSWLVTRFF